MSKRTIDLLPLITGFKKAMADAVAEMDAADLTPAQGCHSKAPTMTSTTTAKIDYEERARFYRVSSRSVRRWVASGIDVHDPIQVAGHLVENSYTPEPLESILSHLEAELELT